MLLLMILGWLGIALLLTSIYRRGARWTPIMIGIGCIILGLFLIHVHTALFGVLAFVTALSAAVLGSTARAHAIAQLCMLLIPSGTLIWEWGHHVVKYQELKARYPLESLEARLAYEPGQKENRPAELALALKSTEALEDRIEAEAESSTSGGLRVEGLREIHETTVADFIKRAGFGFGRHRPLDHVYWVEKEIRLDEHSSGILPPDPIPGSPTLREHAGSPPQAPSSDDLQDLHLDGVIDFVNPKSYGYVKDRSHVAGFIGHYFEEIPYMAKELQEWPFTVRSKWKVTRLDLISLLKHENPRAYVSDELPRMDKLRQAKTRPLTDFEGSMLSELRKGATLRSEAEAGRIRMLGAIRAGRQCLQCHNARRGDLLGAFSYTLSYQGEEPENEEPAGPRKAPEVVRD